MENEKIINLKSGLIVNILCNLFKQYKINYIQRKQEFICNKIKNKNCFITLSNRESFLFSNSSIEEKFTIPKEINKKKLFKFVYDSRKLEKEPIIRGIYNIYKFPVIIGENNIPHSLSEIEKIFLI
jgi:hypothetical protein